jgi:hypothetical protein
MTSMRRRALYALLLSIAAVAAVMAPDRPVAVVAVSPVEGATEPRQTTLFAELDPTFSGELSFQGRAIPMDQLDIIQTGNVRLSFTPGPGKEFSAFPPGRNCAEVTFFPKAEGQASTSTYSWCFTLH